MVFLLKWGLPIVTGYWIIKRNFEEKQYDNYPQKNWDDMDLGEKLRHTQQIPVKELAVLVTITYGVVNITRSFVDYKTK